MSPATARSAARPPCTAAGSSLQKHNPYATVAVLPALRPRRPQSPRAPALTTPLVTVAGAPANLRAPRNISSARASPRSQPKPDLRSLLDGEELHSDVPHKLIHKREELVASIRDFGLQWSRAAAPLRASPSPMSVSGRSVDVLAKQLRVLELKKKQATARDFACSPYVGDEPGSAPASCFFDASSTREPTSTPNTAAMAAAAAQSARAVVHRLLQELAEVNLKLIEVLIFRKAASVKQMPAHLGTMPLLMVAAEAASCPPQGAPACSTLSSHQR